MGRLDMILISLCLLISITNGSHFRGGTVTWKATGNPREIEIWYRFGWRKSYEPHNLCTDDAIKNSDLLEGEGKLEIETYNNNGSKVWQTAVQKMSYRCTDRFEGGSDPSMYWVSGVNSVIFQVPETYGQEFSLRFKDCCWISRLVNYDLPRWWEIKATVNLVPRIDTLKPNIPPRTSSLPIRRIQQGCRRTIHIPYYDADGDDVRCRWSEIEKEECRLPNCGQPHPMFSFVKDAGRKCLIVIDARDQTEGWFAVAVMIEDFITTTSTTPLSTIPFHFLVKVESGSRDCEHVKNVEGEKCIPVIAGKEFNHTVQVITSSPDVPITNFATTKPTGMTRSPIVHVGGGMFSAMFTWTPPISAQGDVQSLCYAPIDNENFSGQEKCVEFAIGGAVPQVNPYLSKPSINQTISSTDKIWELHFDQDIIIMDNANSPFITIHHMNNSVFFNIDISHQKGNSTIPPERPNVLQFVLPATMPPLQDDTMYKISIHHGLISGKPQCHILNAPYMWTFNTSRRIQPALPPQTLMKTTTVTHCYPTFMESFIDRKWFDDVDPSFIAMNDPDCYAMYYNETHFLIGSTYGKCGTRAVVNEDQSRVSMINTIHIPYPFDLSEGKSTVFEIDVNCSISTRRVAYVEFNPNVTVIKMKQDNIGEFNFSLKMFPGEDYRQFYRVWDFPIDVEEKQRLFFEARSFEMPGFGPFLSSCVATPTSNPGGNLKYEFIKDQCAMDETVVFHHSPRYTRIRFSIEAFSFLTHAFDSTVFVHCDMRLCRKGPDCRPSCQNDGISKRSTHSVAMTDEYMDTDGPIRIIHHSSDSSKIRNIVPGNSKWLFANDIYLTVVSSLLLFISLGLMIVLWNIRKHLKQLRYDAAKTPLPVLTLKQ